MLLNAFNSSVSTADDADFGGGFNTFPEASIRLCRWLTSFTSGVEDKKAMNASMSSITAVRFADMAKTLNECRYFKRRSARA